MNIVDVDLHDGELQVVRCGRDLKGSNEQDTYNVVSNGVVRHPDSSAEDVMRALGHYIHGLSHALKKAKETK